MNFRGGLLPRLLALFPLLLPLYLIKGTFLGVPVNFPELVLGVLALLFCFEHPPFRGFEWRYWAVWTFLAAAVLSAVIVPDSTFFPDGSEFPAQLRALGILKGWVLLPGLYFVMARATFRDKPSLVSWALNALLASGLGLAIWALNQVWTGHFLTPDGRASGPFESANYLALYCGPLVVYAGLRLWGLGAEFLKVRREFLAERRDGPRGQGREALPLREFLKARGVEAALFLLAAGLLAAALYFSKSYAAWLAVLGAFGIFGLQEAYAKSRRHFVGALVFLAILALGLVASQWGTPKFEQALDLTGQSSSSVRLQIYQIAWALLQQHPWLGIGLGQFEQQYQVVAPSVLGQAPMEAVMLHSHNLFLMTWLSMGLLGLLSLCGLLWKALAWLGERDRHGRFVAAFMLLEVVFHGFFDTPLFKNDLAFEWWLLMAILI